MFHLSLKNEAFHNIVPINLRQTIRVCREYQNHYNKFHPHQGIRGNIPDQLFKNRAKVINFSEKQQLGGKITSFEPIFESIA